MRLNVIKYSSIKNIILPEEVNGSYWIDSIDINGNKRNLILIEAEKGKWKLISNNNVYYINNDVMVPFEYLELNKIYTIKNEFDKDTFLIYCSPTIEKYNVYELKDFLNKVFSIGRKSNCLVRYDLVDDVVCNIKLNNNKIILENTNSSYGIYVNNSRILNHCEIKIGDVLFIYGLRILFSSTSGSNGSFVMYVNDVDIKDISVDSIPVGNITSLAGDFNDDFNDNFYPLYDENEFFYKKPRIVPKLNTLNINIDEPPQKQDGKESPFLLTIGPMITMSMSSLMMGYNSLSSVANGSSSLKDVLPSLIVCGAMFASIFVWPLLIRLYQKIDNSRKEIKRQKKYNKYIDNKIEEISKAKNEQSSLLKMHFFSSEQCADVIINHSSLMWQRRITDDDYLTVNLGIGSCPMKININYPEEHFTLDEDKLKKLVLRLGNEPKNLDDVPIPYSFLNNYISGIFGINYLHDYVRRLLIQILAFHSYDDLKIVILTDEEHESEWNVFKSIPHIFSDDRKYRFFATNNEEYKEICYYLNRLYDNNLNNKDKVFKQLYLIITDSFKKIRDIDIIKNLLENGSYNGFSLFIMDKKMTNFPDQCTSFIDLSLISNDNYVGEIKNNLDTSQTISFKVDFNSIIDFEKCVKILANTPIDIKNDNDGKLPNKIGFLEMYEVGKIEQLNSSIRWNNNNPVLSLSAPVGVGKNGELITLDLHEKYHGPHGLIAGMTGSGKSEFIITYILSMALNYSPYEVQFILIDYKGGGLAGAFENKITGVKLPHLIGSITNLDSNEIKRSFASIESELKRRQSLFNNAREISGESTIDIYKYQKMYRQGLLKIPVSHLFIVCDEFAELKQQQPEFMEQLISTARIGRSLGVHLILATQKPTGVVDPQIWSNTRFRVCLRVQDTSDSNEIIKKPDAAFLKQTGRFYFQVGYDEVYTIGQASYAGGSYMPSETIKKEVDTSVDFINNIGYTTRKIETKPIQKSINKSCGEELGNIVRYLSNIALEQNIICKPLWLEKIPPVILVDNLKEKYKFVKEKYIINPIIGEYDVPSMQEQRLLTLPITNNGNSIVYGAAGSGKENFITTVLYSSMLSYSSDEVNYYIIDFGSGALNIFKNSNLVGDILQGSDNDKIENLFKMIKSTIDERKRMFASYGGSYKEFINNNVNNSIKVPNIVIIINNYESYIETFDKYDDMLNTITRDCYKYGIYFLITVNTPNGVRFKLKQNFSLIYALNQNNDDDFSYIINGVRTNYPAKLFGRGLVKIDNIYEFQTAMVSEENIASVIKDKITSFNNINVNKAKSIPVLPDIVTLFDIKNYIKRDDNVVIGISKNSLMHVDYNFGRNLINVITGSDLYSYDNFINCLINQIIYKQCKNLIVLNGDEFKINDDNKKYYQYIDKDFDDFINKFNSYLQNLKEQYEKNNFNVEFLKQVKPMYFMIIGVDNVLSKIKITNNKVIDNIFNLSNELGLINFIFVDNVDKIKKLELETWYRSNFNKNFGIWLGSGLENQFSINVIQRNPYGKQDVPNNFCFVVNRGKAEYVKYVEKFDLTNR